MTDGDDAGPDRQVQVLVVVLRPAGADLCRGGFKITGNPVTSTDFQDWGWRIPFLVSVLLVGGALSAIFGFFYTASGYAGKNPKGVPPGILGLSSPTILTVQIIAAVVFVALCGWAALDSDRFGRRRVMRCAGPSE